MNNHRGTRGDLPSAPTPCVSGWLAHLELAVPELHPDDWTRLREFEVALRQAYPGPPRLGGHPGRGDELLAVRRTLAPLIAEHDAALTGRGAAAADLLQAARQIICGYHDLDLRDATGLGHGRIIARHAGETARQRWVPRLRAGELAGIAMTEAGGGTRIRSITTKLVPAPGHSWRLHGEKRWISRLAEAAVFVVFARVVDGPITAVIVNAAAPGIHRHPEQPAGLAGWTWGRLVFDNVPIAHDDVLAATDGLEVFAAHFSHYRALVTATAVGAGAAAHDIVTVHLADRGRRGEIDRVRDHALIALGRTHAQINSGLLAALHTQRLAAHGRPAASLWGRTIKAHGVDLARRAADELTVLIGAAGFSAAHRLQKLGGDLAALRYADGVHDSLYLSAGRALLRSATATPSE